MSCKISLKDIFYFHYHVLSTKKAMVAILILKGHEQQLKKGKNSSGNSLHLSLAVSVQHNCHKNVTTCPQISSHLFPILNLRKKKWDVGKCQH